MAVPLLAVAGLGLQALTLLTLLALDDQERAREFENGNSLPNPEPSQPPFAPPFEGGQCLIQYTIALRVRQFEDGGLINTQTIGHGNSQVYFGAIRSIQPAIRANGDEFNGYKVADNENNGAPRVRTFGTGFSTYDPPLDVQIDQIEILPANNDPDNCGDVPNPNTPLPPSGGGGSLAPIDDGALPVAYGAPPLLTAGGLLAALRAIADAIEAAADILEGINRIGEAINKLRELFQEKEKENPRKRSVSAGGWRDMPVDGGFGTAKYTAVGIEYSPYQLQIEIKEFPSTVSRRLGVNSPAFAHLEPIGWIFLRSANGGYSEPVPLRYLRNSISLTEDTTGVSFSFRENPQTVAQCRVWYSSPPSDE